MAVGLLVEFLYCAVVVYVFISLTYSYRNIWNSEKDKHPLLRILSFHSMLSLMRNGWDFPRNKLILILIFAAVGCVVDLVNVGQFVIEALQLKAESFEAVVLYSLLANALVLTAIYILLLAKHFPEFGKYNILVAVEFGLFTQFFHLWVAQLYIPTHLPYGFSSIPETPLERIKVIEGVILKLQGGIHAT